MKAAVEKDIRQEVKDYIDHADDRTVRIIHAMLEAEHDEDEYEAEMERRIKEYEDGTAKLITLDQLEDGARAAYKRRQQQK